MNILAIDTSCDETSAAVIKDTSVLSNIIASQVDLHKKWGGVVPDIARRAHAEQIDQVVNEALSKARIDIEGIDYFAATYGPGLAIALEVGLKKAQEMALEYGKPLVPVNHMEGHLLSPFARNSRGRNPNAPTLRDLPAMGLLISGGHTELVYTEEIGKYYVVGETLDDAAGEAFDKVAKMLNLGYPGGPIISEFAKKGEPGRFDLPIPMADSGDLNFSYSGLKTACLYKLQDIFDSGSGKKASKTKWSYDFCADFVESVVQSLVIKLDAALDSYSKARSVFLGGGVVSNEKLRRRIRAAMKKRGIKVFLPYDKTLFTDNAAMIGVAAYFMVKRDDQRIASTKDAIMNIDRDPVACIDNR